MAAIPVVGLCAGVTEASELHRLIAAHKASHRAFCDAIDRDDAEGTAEAEREWRRTEGAEYKAFAAVCAYRCRTPAEAKLKAEYLLTTSTVEDFWDDEARTLLKSFV